MKQIHVTPFSHLTDEDFLRHLLHKDNPTAEDVEAALRLELLLDGYNVILEDIYKTVVTALKSDENHTEALKHVRNLTAPAIA